MQDLDSAVGRLDNIFMSLYFIVAILIVAVCLVRPTLLTSSPHADRHQEAELVTLVTSAGTLVLGLSWLIGSSLAEVLTSIIFLFIKHPFDVGDQVSIDKYIFTVKEIRLLSTIFLDSNGVFVQAPNTKLNDLVSTLVCIGRSRRIDSSSRSSCTTLGEALSCRKRSRSTWRTRRRSSSWRISGRG